MILSPACIKQRHSWCIPKGGKNREINWWMLDKHVYACVYICTGIYMLAHYTVKLRIVWIWENIHTLDLESNTQVIFHESKDWSVSKMSSAAEWCSFLTTDGVFESPSKPWKSEGVPRGLVFYLPRGISLLPPHRRLHC